MPKVSIDQLENIVLEGGGAKGAAYAGAIKGLEQVFRDHYATHPGDTVPGAQAILDYGTESGGEFEPQIKRFAGSSAGAITSFALALGLNSDQVIEVSNFPFKNFLQETHPGKYRMVGADGKAKIGEDEWKSLCLDENAKDYKYTLTERQEVKDNKIKKLVRKNILKWIVGAVVSGVIDKLRGLIMTLTGNGGGNVILQGLPLNLQGIFNYVLALNATALASGATGAPLPTPQPPALNNPYAFQQVETNKTYFEKFLTKYIPKYIIKYLFHKVSKDSGMKISWDAIGNAIWDRGMFSGFMVREFFFDLIVYASINDTHFHRSYFSEEEQTELKKVKMNMSDGRLKADFSPLSGGLREKLEGLSKLTFAEFYEATGISLTLCVSNLTTDDPMYFSEYWSPDFPVLEAVGASMTIPPALKPVFNNADAFKDHSGKDDFYELRAADVGKKSGRKGEYFDYALYELHRVAIKTWLRTTTKLEIDENSPLNVSAFLPVLRLALEVFRDFQGLRDEVTVEGQPVVITYDLLAYHYNAAYKGLLLDGGYRCNIPYNVFRTMVVGEDVPLGQIDPLLEQTLAIKLDNTYPREWINAIYRSMAEIDGLDTKVLAFDKKRKKAIGKLIRLNLPIAIQTVRSSENGDFLSREDLKRFNDECYERIAVDILDLQQKATLKNRVPWNGKKSILNTAFEGYSYGSENGQIRYLSDHEHIIPLYSYGLGTYDFDLAKIQGLVELSQKKSEDRVKAYFE